MKKLLASLFVVSAIAAIVLSCQKENSFESGAGPSQGLLQGAGGDCLPKLIVGTYIKGTALNGTADYIQVSVDVVATGTYVIASDTANGVYFRATGTFTTLGIQTINLRGNGTPALDGPFNFTIKYADQECDVQITFLPSGAGGPAVFTLDQTGGNCSATPNGTYTLNTALVAGNTVTLNVTVTQIGTYNISTTFQGMTFASGAGTFATTGAHTVTLLGTGTPTTAGANVVPVTVGTSTCNFTITVGSAATGTLGGSPGACTPAPVNGTFTAGVATVPGTNTVTVTVTFATPGNYAISTNTVNGYSFSATGTAVAGTTTVVLQSNGGTPAAAGTNNFTVTFGTSTCTFPVTVVANVTDYFPRTANSNWSYEWDDDADDTLRRRVIVPTHSALGNTWNIFQVFNELTSTYDSGGYYRKQATDYYEWVDITGFVGMNEVSWAQYIFLKDIAVATNWKSAPISGTVTDPNPPNPTFPITARFSYTIDSRPATLSFTTSTGAQTFNDIIVVKEEFEIEAPVGTWTNASNQLGFTKSYYAKNIGLVKFELYDETGTLTDWLELRRWTVLP